MDEWQIERFNRSHERAGFSCGNDCLDDFIHSRVSQYERRTLGRTYVAVARGGKMVVGYYTLCTGAIPFPQLPPKLAKKLPKHPLPAILLGRLAVDQSVQGRRLGELLLIDALRLSLALSEKIGVYAVEVQAIDDRAKRFYERYQFLPLADDDLHLYLPIAVIEDMIGRA
jgi:GNAT superfamily N-acetyltransferase